MNDEKHFSCLEKLKEKMPYSLDTLTEKMLCGKFFNELRAFTGFESLNTATESFETNLSHAIGDARTRAKKNSEGFDWVHRGAFVSNGGSDNLKAFMQGLHGSEPDAIACTVALASSGDSDNLKASMQGLHATKPDSGSEAPKMRQEAKTCFTVAIFKLTGP